jgi:hypothetical protein
MSSRLRVEGDEIGKSVEAFKAVKSSISPNKSTRDFLIKTFLRDRINVDTRKNNTTTTYWVGVAMLSLNGNTCELRKLIKDGKRRKPARGEAHKKEISSMNVEME